ncbi:radical SAM protein [Roseivirga sp. BDSF3-8]|uniref:radical SAM protein n=1 Tax=Roseivirga sp. BDSF3-8 TaxID=3241598 RepID=UPI0035318784
MKVSKFNSFVPYKGKFVAFNSLTLGFIILDPFLYELYTAGNRDNEINKLKQVHPAFFNTLSDKGFIVPDEKDEDLSFRALRDSIDMDDSNYTLIINPTMNCNFKCWYCYESHIKGSKLNDETQEKIKRHISHVFKNQKGLKNFHLSWFGGEPLLYFEQAIVPISDYATEIFKNSDVSFSMSFTTNGYLISEKVIKKLKDYNVTTLQITLDGSLEQHNKVRYVNYNKGSYKKIVENIKALTTSGLNVHARINYTEETLESINNVIDDFEDLDYETRTNLTFSFHNVWQEGDPKIDKVESIITAFRTRGFITSSQFSNVDTVRQSCYADKKYQATINYNGEIHKCTARDFTSDRTEGILEENGSISWNDKYYKRLNSKFKNNPCNSCRIQPICNGGCSQVALENIDNDYCVWESQGVSKDQIILSRFKHTIESKILQEALNEKKAIDIQEETIKKASATA